MIQVIPLSDLRDPRIPLRVPDKRSLEYAELTESVKDLGVLSNLIVRPWGGNYEIIDGSCRKEVCVDLGIKEVTCQVINATDQQVILIQIQANAVRLETKPVEYARHLRRLQKFYPETTLLEIANRICKSTAWVENVLSLDELSDQIKDKIEKGRIPLGSAYLLARMPKLVANELAPSAERMKVSEFKKLGIDAIHNGYRTLNAIKRNSHESWEERKNNLEKGWLRNVKAIESELLTGERAPIVLAQEDARNPLDGFRAGLKFCLHLDEEGKSKRQQRKEKPPDLETLYTEHKTKKASKAT